MKKTLLLLGLILASYMLNAQGFGIQAGYNSAKFTFPNDNLSHFEHISSVGGINLGINYDFEIADNFYIEPGLLYSQKGYAYLAEEEGSYEDGVIRDFTSTTKINYLEIPVFAKYSYGLNDNLYLIGKLGLSYGFALSGEYTWDNGVETESNELEFGDSKDYKSSDFGINLGAGIKISNFEIGINYFTGSNIDYSDSNSDFVTKNKVFSINLGYRFESN